MSEELKIKNLFLHNQAEGIFNCLLKLYNQLKLSNALELGELKILCIGSCTLISGDMYGSLVGSYLKELEIKQIIGSMNNPVHALNVEEHINRLKENFVIVIDAFIAKKRNLLHNIEVDLSSISPGSGVGRSLPFIGDISISGYTVFYDDKVDYYKMFNALKNADMLLLDRMARATAKAVYLFLSSKNLIDLENGKIKDLKSTKTFKKFNEIIYSKNMKVVD